MEDISRQRIHFPAHADTDIDDCIPRGVLERLRNLALIARLLEFDICGFTERQILSKKQGQGHWTRMTFPRRASEGAVDRGSL